MPTCFVSTRTRIFHLHQNKQRSTRTYNVHSQPGWEWGCAYYTRKCVRQKWTCLGSVLSEKRGSTTSEANALAAAFLREWGDALAERGVEAAAEDARRKGVLVDCARCEPTRSRLNGSMQPRWIFYARAARCVLKNVDRNLSLVQYGDTTGTELEAERREPPCMSHRPRFMSSRRRGADFEP